MRDYGQRLSGKGTNWMLRGDYNDFISFGFLLKANNYEVGAGSSYRKVLGELLKSGKIKNNGRWDGRLDGYEAKDKDGKTINDVESFYKDLNAMDKSKNGLYEKQKQGVAWLYGSGSKVLGDKTGTRKNFSINCCRKYENETIWTEEL